jgi:hypothetical protein
MANLVNYVKKLWKDAPSTDSPINAVNLNHIEDGIFNNASAINTLGERADDLETDVTQINADLTANNKKYQADYQNGKYGFTINNEFYQIGGGGMPTLDFSNPLFTFSTTNTTYTATKECYLVGSIVGSGGDAAIRINNIEVYRVGQTAAGWSPIPITKISAGDTVTTEGVVTNSPLHIYDTVN